MRLASRSAAGLLAGLLLAACGGGAAPAGRQQHQTVTLAEAADPSRDLYLYAIQHGLVSSPQVDLKVTSMGLNAIIQAAGSKQFDIIEAATTAPVLSAQQGFRMTVLSPNVVNKGGTLLLTAQDSPVRSPADLKGRVVGVASLGGIFTLETRYVLQQGYHLNTDPTGGDVRFQVAPVSALPELLASGKVAAIVTSEYESWQLEGKLRVLVETSKEFARLMGSQTVNSILVTYPDVVGAKGPALQAAVQLLARSRDYFLQHQDSVIAAVAAQDKVDPASLRWFQGHYDIAQGQPVDRSLGPIAAVWKAANVVGQVKTLPAMSDFLAPWDKR